jgi:hypothetical protein
MSQETNSSVDYLIALRQSRGSASAAAAPALAPTQSPRDEPASSSSPRPDPRGAEKRRSPRFKCDGKAELRQGLNGMRTWATFTDISFHGCYLEIPATYPVGTILQLKLQACGVQIETQGDVRVNYPGFGMGVAFAGMTEANRERLKQILALIPRSSVIMSRRPVESSSTVQAQKPSAANHSLLAQAVIAHFESQEVLTRGEFLRILNSTQKDSSS